MLVTPNLSPTCSSCCPLLLQTKLLHKKGSHRLRKKPVFLPRYASRVLLSACGSTNGTLRKVEPLPCQNKGISPLLGRCICLRGSSRRTRHRTRAGLVDSSHDDITLIFHYLIHRDCAERTIKTSLGRQEPTAADYVYKT